MVFSPPELDEIIIGARGMFAGIDACVRAECLMSAVSLTYSSIDALAALTRAIDKLDATRAEFISWVESYMLPRSRLGCSAVDVYAARCAVLHSYGGGSALRRSQKARYLVYYWRNGPHPAKGALDLPSDTVHIVVEDLVEAFKTGATIFRTGIANDQDLINRVSVHLPQLFCFKPDTPMELRTEAWWVL